MLEAFLKDPSAVTVGGLLLSAVVAFWRGWVIPVSIHDAIVRKLEAQNAESKAEAKASNTELIALLKRQIEVTDRSLLVAEQVRLASANSRNRREGDVDDKLAPASL